MFLFSLSLARSLACRLNPDPSNRLPNFSFKAQTEVCVHHTPVMWSCYSAMTSSDKPVWKQPASLRPSFFCCTGSLPENSPSARTNTWWQAQQYFKAIMITGRSGDKQPRDYAVTSHLKGGLSRGNRAESHATRAATNLRGFGGSAASCQSPVCGWSQSLGQGGWGWDLWGNDDIAKDYRRADEWASVGGLQGQDTLRESEDLPRPRITPLPTRLHQPPTLTKHTEIWQQKPKKEKRSREARTDKKIWVTIKT